MSVPDFVCRFFTTYKRRNSRWSFHKVGFYYAPTTWWKIECTWYQFCEWTLYVIYFVYVLFWKSGIESCWIFEECRSIHTSSQTMSVRPIVKFINQLVCMCVCVWFCLWVSRICTFYIEQICHVDSFYLIFLFTKIIDIILDKTVRSSCKLLEISALA